MSTSSASTPHPSTWVIGDVHGCHRELKRLYRRLDFDPDRDTLWLTGDLVNRGPDSAKVLRWCCKREKKLGARFQTVLGNHDLHALAIQHGVGKLRDNDTLEDLLEAKDRDSLFDWLLHRPFLVRRKKALLVHAGLLPDWTAKEAERQAQKLAHKILEDPARFIREKMSRKKQLALAAMTRMRTLDKKGRQGRYSGSLAKVPKRLTPWFRVEGRRTAGVAVVCGHWAALGFHQENNVTCLDTGCVWGGSLTAYRLEDGTVLQESNDR